MKKLTYTPPVISFHSEVLSELARIEAVVVQAHTEVGQLHVVAVVVRPQFVQELLQLQGHLYSIASK